MQLLCFNTELCYFLTLLDFIIKMSSQPPSRDEDNVNQTGQLPEVSAETLALINAVLLAQDRREDASFRRTINMLEQRLRARGLTLLDFFDDLLDRLLQPQSEVVIEPPVAELDILPQDINLTPTLEQIAGMGYATNFCDKKWSHLMNKNSDVGKLFLSFIYDMMKIPFFAPFTIDRPLTLREKNLRKSRIALIVNYVIEIMWSNGVSFPTVGRQEGDERAKTMTATTLKTMKRVFGEKLRTLKGVLKTSRKNSKHDASNVMEEGEEEDEEEEEEEEEDTLLPPRKSSTPARTSSTGSTKSSRATPLVNRDAPMTTPLLTTYFAASTQKKGVTKAATRKASTPRSRAHDQVRQYELTSKPGAVSSSDPVAPRALGRGNRTRVTRNHVTQDEDSALQAALEESLLTNRSELTKRKRGGEEEEEEEPVDTDKYHAMLQRMSETRSPMNEDSGEDTDGDGRGSEEAMSVSSEESGAEVDELKKAPPNKRVKKVAAKAPVTRKRAATISKKAPPKKKGKK